MEFRGIDDGKRALVRLGGRGNFSRREPIKEELGILLDIARIEHLVDVVTSSGDVERSKPAPDIFEVVLKKLQGSRGRHHR